MASKPGPGERGTACRPRPIATDGAATRTGPGVRINGEGGGVPGMRADNGVQVPPAGETMEGGGREGIRDPGGVWGIFG